MTVMNDCTCQHVGYCDGSCQHPAPDGSPPDPQTVFTAPDGKVWYPHRGYWCFKASEEIEHLKSLNKDAHAIIDKIWSIFGTPTYEQLEGRTIYDMVQNCVDREREAAAVNEQAAGVIYNKMADIERLEAALHRIIELDHHNMGPESQATKIARAALNGGAA